MSARVTVRASLPRPAGLVTITLLAAGLLAACSGGHRVARTAPTTASTAAPTTAAPSTTRAPKPRDAIARCPLTWLPAPHGRVPQRPALAVKVENLPAARPQYGLSEADIVFEEPVEGGITRFIVVYQCHDASRIEPIRSGRIIDPEIVRQLGAHPLFAYAGAIDPATAAIDSSPLIDVGIYRAPASAYWRDPSRYAPHNLVSSTAVLYAVGRHEHASSMPPPPLFSYGPLPATAVPAARVHIAYPYSDLTWTWQPKNGNWARSYADTGIATQGEGGQVTATNVVVLQVVMYPSPFVEDPTGAHENLLRLTGSGAAEVFRNGALIRGTWVRPSLAQTTRLLDVHNHPITLSPGTTWVELVPTTVPVAATP